MATSQIRSEASPAGVSSQPAPLARGSGKGGRTGSSRVSPTMGRMEPWVSWSLAAYTAWIALFSFPDLPVLWLFVLYAGVLGQWCRLFPSRRQGRMFIHGALLVCAAYLLHSHVAWRLGGPGGPFFFWTAIPVLTYGLMLRPGWAVMLVTLAVSEFAASSAMNGSVGTTAIAQAGFLVLFPLGLAIPFGEAMREPAELLEQTRIDRTTGLLNKEGLLMHGDELLRDCRHEKRPATVAVFCCEDLRAVREMYGRKTSRKSLELLIAKLQAVAGSRGLVARTGAAEFTLMLPGLARDKALQAISRQLGNPLRLEFEIGGEEIVMAPLVVLESVTPEEASIDAVYVELETEVQRQLQAARGGNLLDQPLPAPQRPPAQRAAAPVLADHLPDSGIMGHMPSLPPTIPVALGGR